MNCKGCNKKVKLVKAHIIPESFFRYLREDENTLKLVPTDKDHYVKKAPIGIYDKDILCGECEAVFQDVDEYAAKLMLNDQNMSKLHDKGDVVGYNLKDIDYQKLKLFVMSILWRASISGAEFYKNVRLGPLEFKLKEMIWNRDTGGSHDYSFVLGKFEEDGTLSKVILDPHPERWFGKRYYRFYLAGYVLYVKVDSQKTPDLWAKFIPESNDIYILSRGEVRESKEFAMMRDAVVLHKT